MSFQRDEASRVAYFERAEKAYEKQLAKLWRDALADIRNEMSKIYERYSTNGILTRADMTRYNRLTTLEKDLSEIIKPVARESTKIVDRMKPKEYGEAFWRTAWAFDNETGVALKWGALDKKAVIAALDNPFFDASKESFWFNANNRIKAAVSNGLALGQSYTDMMRDLKAMINRDNYDIMRVLRTELHSSQEAGTMASYEEAADKGIKGKTIWVATLDGRTRDSHAAMDGVEQDSDGMFRGSIGEAPYPGWEGLPAEERIHCRCDVRYEVSGFAPIIRRSREDGIIPYQNYSEWINNKTIWK